MNEGKGKPKKRKKVKKDNSLHWVSFKHVPNAYIKTNKCTLVICSQHASNCQRFTVPMSCS